MENKFPSVTVIIPNYNHARYLPQRIESVLEQNYQDFELIVLDDCSPDNSREVIAAYAARDPRIRVVLNERNSGSTFKQWNKGIGQALGKYIWIAESDDAAEPDFLTTLVSILEADNEIVLAYSNSFDIDSDSIVKGTWTTFLTELDPIWETDLVADGKTLIQRFMSYRNIVPNASAVVMRTAVVRDAGPAEENFRVCGDWIFWARLMSRGKVAYVARPLNYFRSHLNNARSKSFVDGVGLEETTRVLVLMHQYGKPDPFYYKLAIKSILNYWYDLWIYYDVSWPRHKVIFSNLSAVEPRLVSHMLRVITRVFDNKAGGLRILLGDKFLYRLLKK